MASAPPSAGQSAGALPDRILLVDDERALREPLAAYLGKQGFNVREAESAAQARSMLQDEPADLVLLDLTMPGIDGIEVARKLSEQTTPPAVIFVTAHESFAVEAFDLDAVDYVLKPVAAERLGWDYRYETELLSAAPVVDGVLQGDLVVRGSGDPSINAEGASGTPVFDLWTETLRQDGISAIEGRIIGDDNLVEEAAPGYGWSWDDLPYGYAAPTGALVHRDNMVRLTVHSGSVAGEDTLVEVSPRASGVRVVNRVDTDIPDTEVELALRRGPDGPLEMWGAIPASGPPVSRTASIARGPALGWIMIWSVAVMEE